jgi:hypothetical protein
MKCGDGTNAIKISAIIQSVFTSSSREDICNNATEHLVELCDTGKNWFVPVST